MISFSVVLSLAGVRPRVSRQSSSSAGAGRGKRIDAYVRVSMYFQQKKLFEETPSNPTDFYQPS